MPGIGTGGGLKGYVQDRAGAGLRRWKARPGRWRARRTDAGHPAGVHAVQHARRRSRRISTARKSELLGVPISRVFEAISVYIGSAFVNDFNLLGRTYRVTAQADNPYRLGAGRREAAHAQRRR